MKQYYCNSKCKFLKTCGFNHDYRNNNYGENDVIYIGMNFDDCKDFQKIDFSDASKYIELKVTENV